MCQREAEAQKEAVERRKLQKELQEQRGLIDALTAETMTLREEAAALQVRLCLVSCPSSRNLFLHDRLFCYSERVADANGRVGAEVGHSGAGDGRTRTAGRPYEPPQRLRYQVQWYKSVYIQTHLKFIRIS